MQKTPGLAAAAEALDVREHGDMLALARSAAELMNTHGFSLAQTEKLTGLPRTRLRALTEKTSNTGGALSADAVRILVRVAELPAGDVQEARLVADAIEAGASVVVAARLLGETTDWVRHRVGKAKRGRANA